MTTVFIVTEAGLCRGSHDAVGRWAGGGQWVSGFCPDALHLGQRIRLTWAHPTDGVEVSAEAVVSVLGLNDYFVADIVAWADEERLSDVVVRERTTH